MNVVHSKLTLCKQQEDCGNQNPQLKESLVYLL